MQSGRLKSTGVEGSKIWPVSPLAQIRAVTPLSQAVKSNLEVRMKICVTLDRVFEAVEDE